MAANPWPLRGFLSLLTATHLREKLRHDHHVEIVPQTTMLFLRALQRYRERADKEWGLTDCASFVIMEERGITEALTHDHHFVQAGFRALLREDDPAPTA